MPQEADDPISQASQGVNWLVGLSGAAIGGALAKLDWILKFPDSGKFAFLIATLFFFLSIVFGVFYAFQLFALKQLKQKLEDEKSKQPRVEKDKDVQEAHAKLVKANDKVKRFHNCTMVTFAGAGIATLFCLYFVLFYSTKPPVPPKPTPVASNHYILTNAPVHIGGRLSHTHTFLLNQQTGEVWVMTCRPDQTVAFRRVHKLDFEGRPEDATASSKPEGKDGG